jgi:hypothetical protein
MHHTKKCYKKPEDALIMEEVVRGGANEVCLSGKLLDTEIRTGLDTGATRSFICHELENQLNFTPREPSLLNNIWRRKLQSNQSVFEINLVLESF